MMIALLACPSLPTLLLSWLYYFNSFGTPTWITTWIVSVSMPTPNVFVAVNTRSVYPVNRRKIPFFFFWSPIVR
jgi:hypothetical protein